MAVNVVIDMLKNIMNAVCENGNLEKRGWRKRRYVGFTVAEMLIIVAIIGVLAGVSFVAVQNYQKSTTQLQYDAIAKEIFVAAQNHLTMAKSENYQDTDALHHSKGTPGNADADVKSGEGSTTVYNDDIYYFKNTDYTSEGTSILDQMLPFGSIELVTGGNFIIRYQPKAAKVLDVFYWVDTSQDRRYGISSVDYKKAVDDYRDTINDAGAITSSKKMNRSNYEGSGGILGWFGGEITVETGEYINAPEIKVINGEKLLVEVRDKNADDPSKADLFSSIKLKLIVEGDQSGAKVAIPLPLKTETNTVSDRVQNDPVNNVVTVILDDITKKSMHFSNLNDTSNYTLFNYLKDDSNNVIPFIPGENIAIQAVAYSNSVLTSVAYSGAWITNSLFEEASQNTPDELNAAVINDTVNMRTPGENDPLVTAKINKFRHLENLDATISCLDQNDDNNKLDIKNAMQTADLDWNDFVDEFGTGEDSTKTVQIILADGTTAPAGYLPVTPSHANTSDVTEIDLSYDGKEIISTTKTVPDAENPGKTKEETTIETVNHSIKNIVIDVADNAGLFAKLPDNSSVKNLALIDFNVTSTSGSAGALAGTLTQSTALTSGANVSNVVAYNTGKATAATINTAGDAGGLIGKVKGDESATDKTAKAVIEKSAAALVVTSTGGNAGGLIGSMEGGTLTDCYSGGHTKDGEYYNGTTPIYNVTATAGTAGGLIGVATNMGNVANCYSTCSATGKVAGGFAGTYAGLTTAKLENCYATGLVCGTETEAVSLTIGSGASATTKAYTAVPKDGAFAYSLTGLTADNITGCSYYEIINERVEHEDATAKTYAISTNKPSGSMTSADLVAYLTAFGKLNVDGKDAGNDLYNITALDASANDYNTFVGAPDTWNKAVPYDGTLLKYYSVGVDDDSKPDTDDVMEARFSLKGIKRLDATVTDDYFVATHYGDWPAPEIFVLNTPTS